MKIHKVLLYTCIAALLAGCGPGKLFGPTLTPIPTRTSLPTSTPIPTHTPTATSIPTSPATATTKPTNTTSPTSACLGADGKWESEETTPFFGSLVPLIIFTISNCQITAWNITAYPAEDELWMWDGGKIQVVDNQFTYSEDTGEGVFTIEGIFDSENASHGTIEFAKGFSIFGYVLAEDVSLPWRASPAK